MENVGCKYLSRGKWPKLKILKMSIHIYYIVDCKIYDEGCLYLSRANWPSFKKIELSNAFNIKAVILLG